MGFGDFSLPNISKQVGKAAAWQVVRPGKWAIKNPKTAIGITLIVIAVVVLMATSSFGATALMGGHAAWVPGFFSLVNVTASSLAHIGMAIPYVMTASVGLLSLSGFAVAGAKKAIKSEKYHNLTFGGVVDGEVTSFQMNEGELMETKPDHLDVLMQETVTFKTWSRDIKVRQYTHLKDQFQGLTQEHLKTMYDQDLSYLFMVEEKLFVITSNKVGDKYTYQVETKKGDATIAEYISDMFSQHIITSLDDL